MPELSYVARLDDLSERERTVTAVITTDAIDAYKEVVLAKGVDLKRYRSNPVVLWAHNRDMAHGTMPIGKNLWIKPTKNEKGLVACTKFADTEEGQGLFKLYADEVLRAWSIGFDEGADCGPPTPKEIKARPDLAECRRVYRKSVLLEYSAVPIPANGEALTLAVSKGLWLPEQLREQAKHRPAPTGPSDDDAPELPPLVGRSFGQVHAALVRQCRSQFNPAQMARDEVDRRKGKV